jgi:hypothetical protein
MYVCITLCMYVRMYVYTYVCMYACMYVYTYVCMCMYIYLTLAHTLSLDEVALFLCDEVLEHVFALAYRFQGFPTHVHLQYLHRLVPVCE